MNGPTFWNDQEKAKAVIQELKGLNAVLKPFEELVRQADNLEATIELAEEAETDEFDDEIRTACEQAEADFEAFEFRSMLGGPNDHCNAFVTIHAGAGGTEACDWAEMLLRMYLMWAESKGFTTEITDREDGGAAGIQEATIHIKGEYAYGYLRGETGVHRLVRISPFDSNAAAAHVVRLGRRPARGRRHDRHRAPRRRPEARRVPLAAGPAASTRTRPSRACATPTCRPASPPSRAASARSTRTTPTPWPCSRPS